VGFQSLVTALIFKSYETKLKAAFYKFHKKTEIAEKHASMMNVDRQIYFDRLI
jgi:hypothetical protein